MIKGTADKNNNNVNFKLITAFNDFIAGNSLREIHRTGSKCTWTNKQDQPVMVTLNRVLASGDWELHFPLCSLKALTRIGSDHNPLVLDSGEGNIQRSYIFFFEKQ